jgi:hypothetical protein
MRSFLVLFAALVLGGELPKEMDALFAEGKRWFQEAGNTDLGTAERNAARVKAWKALWPAKEALDAYEEENPGGMEEANRKYGEIRSMIYWLRKESPIGLLEGSGVGPAKADPEPAPPKEEPKAEPKAAPPSPLEALFAAAESYEKRHPFDVPGAHARWLKVVAACDDPSNEIARKAAVRAADLETRLKDAYKLLRDDDPEALQGIDNVRIKGMAIAVARDLLSRDPAVREKAGKTLGALGHGEAIYYLKRALPKEEVDGPADAMVQALERIGGPKGCEALADLNDDSRHAGRAFDALLRISGRNSVDRRTAARQMGRYIGARDDEQFDRMMKAFKGMGDVGLVGLAASLGNNTTYARLLKVIDLLSNSKEPSVAALFVRYFQEGRGPRDAEVRAAAMNAVRKMAKPENCGEDVIPHLFGGLRVVASRAYTTALLQELTGKDFSVDKWGYWSDWWKSTHPAKAGKAKKP